MNTNIETLHTERADAEEARDLRGAIGTELNELKRQRSAVAARAGNNAAAEDRVLRARADHQQALAKFSAGELDESGMALARQELDAAENWGNEIEQALSGFDRMIEFKERELKDAAHAFDMANKLYWSAVLQSLCAELAEHRPILISIFEVSGRIQHQSMPDLHSIFDLPRESLYLDKALSEQRESIERKYGLREREEAAA